MTDKHSADLFGFSDCAENRWEDEWVAMPEYNNKDMSKPVIRVNVLFASTEDFERFCDMIRSHLGVHGKVFDGRQRTKEKTMWFPPMTPTPNARYIQSPND